MPRRLISILLTTALAIHCFAGVLAAQEVGQRLARLQQKFNDQQTAQDHKAAEKTAIVMIQIVREQMPGDGASLAAAYLNLAQAYQGQSRYKDAEKLLTEILPILAKDPENFEDLLNAMHTLADVYAARNHYAESETLRKQLIQANIKRYGADHERVGKCYVNYAINLTMQSRFEEADRYARLAKDIFIKQRGPRDPVVASTLFVFATIQRELGHWDRAAEIVHQALSIQEEHFGPQSVQAAWMLRELASIEHSLGRLRDAEKLATRGAANVRQAEGPMSPSLGAFYEILATIQRDQGRYREAEQNVRAALACTVSEQRPLEDSFDGATYLHTLAAIYTEQNRAAEAIPVYQRSLAIRRRVAGPDHPYVGTTLADLANAYSRMGDFQEAIKLRQEALEVWKKSYDEQHFILAAVLQSQGMDLCALNRYDEALPILEKAIALIRLTRGTENFQIASALRSIADLKFETGQTAEAEQLVTQAIEIDARVASRPNALFFGYNLRARLRWKSGQKKAAVEDLDRALEFAELQRGQSSGAERERAQSFSVYGNAFNRMVAWQTELGNIDKAVATIERARARAFADELRVQEIDLFQGRSHEETQQLQTDEDQLRARVSMLEAQLEKVASQRPIDEQARDALQRDGERARAALYDFYRELRASSPIYRDLISNQSQFASLSDMQSKLIGDRTLLLSFLIGDEQSYVAVIDREQAQILPLNITPDDAQQLELEPGMLTAEGLHTVLTNARGSGVLQQLSRPDSAMQSIPRLATLWRVLLPEVVRNRLTDGSLERLVVLPDGPLTLLPLETLVVREATQPTYLLTAGPPILYAPSATVLQNLQARETVELAAAAPPLLSVGDPAYAPLPTKLAAPATVRSNAQPAEINAASDLATRDSRFAGELNRLPFSGRESHWVAEVFAKAGMRSITLKEEEATEAKVRAHIVGRQFIHLACHGMCDSSYGNFYGALAFAPGSKAGDPSNDGLLTLAEIYGLDLRSSELAILSACMTNYGPQQQGEGVWALSRGFLVAGSKRVVASDWIVDDEAGASLISYFAAGVAKSHGDASTPDYALALQAAKRWVHSQEKWQSPFYWAPFVLVGPH